MANPSPTDDTLPEAVVDERRRVSLVWLIPLVAVVAAVWLGYHTWQQQGPLITIRFDTAEGLEAGKTRVRFKDVDIGVVEAIELSADLSQVRVRARLAAHVSDYLNGDTRFWVVRPRLSGGQVSGLETIVGGTYIAADLTTRGGPQRSFEGLETPPIVTATEPGRTFTLNAPALGSVTIGSPLLYRGIEVGRVVGYSLNEPDGVDIQVFVHAPHDVRVGEHTRFWNASGVRVELGVDGIRLESNSLASVLIGGIAFGAPAGVAAGDAVDEGARFVLFADQRAAFEPRFARQELWRVAFSGSVRGLSPGAPVELRGIRVGEVRAVSLELDPADRTPRIPVTIAIEPGRLGIDAPTGDAGLPQGPAERALWDKLVAGGLRAQLKTGNLLTGASYVDLDFYPEAPHREITWTDPVPELPTIPAALDELRALLARLARLPLEQMGENLDGSLAALRDTMGATNALLRRLDRETTTELSQTLQQTRDTLASLDRLLKPNSPLQSEAHRALGELAAAARSLRIMADYLERHPEALIRGKGGSTP